MEGLYASDLVHVPKSKKAEQIQPLEQQLNTVQRRILEECSSTINSILL